MNHEQTSRDEAPASSSSEAARRRYDPDRVDRYVAEQQRRLDAAVERAAVAERKLSAAIGQLRELHRRVGVLESKEQHEPVDASLDTLGERVQRILAEALDGANALRKAGEEDGTRLRSTASAEAEEIVAAAMRKARSIEAESERTRSTYLEKLEEERARAITEIASLDRQRKTTIGELLAMKEAIESTVGGIVAAHHRTPTTTPAGSTVVEADGGSNDEPAAPPAAERHGPSSTSAGAEQRRQAASAPAPARTSGPATMPVYRLDLSERSPASGLVNTHRAQIAELASSVRTQSNREGAVDSGDGVFDFDAQ